MKIVLSLLVVGLITMTVACDTGFLTEGNPSAASVESSFKTNAEAKKAVIATYSAMQGNDAWSREAWWISDMLSDECASGGSNLEAHRANLLNYNIDASNPTIASAWKGIYRVIHRANFVIEILPEKANQELLAEDINVFVSEAKFLRAFCYFELVTYWGTVPLTLKPIIDLDGKGVPMATSEDEIYNVIIDDLKAAEEFLPSVTVYRGKKENLGRATKEAAQALLGKVQLYRGNNIEAKAALTKVKDSGNFTLVGVNYEDNHREENENNMESIFEIQFGRYAEGNGDTGWDATGDNAKIQHMRSQEYSAFKWHNTIPSENLRNAFEDNDPRYKLNFLEYGDTFGPNNDVFKKEDVLQGVKEDINGGDNIAHWKKYGYEYKFGKEGGFWWSGINLRVIRYADILLMLAEIENEAGASKTAVGYLNDVRDRVGMPHYPTADYPTGTKDEVFQAIVHERQVELCSEQIRARDVKRWYRQGKVPKPHANYLPKHKYLPIPINEIDNNSALSSNDQKPGY